MNNVCRICSSSKNQNYIAKEMMFGTRDQFNYFQCDDCRCLQIETIPENIADYYPGDYYSFRRYDGKKFNGPGGKLNRFIFNYSIFHRGPVQLFLEWLVNPVKYSQLLSILKVSKESRILDVGCGNGEAFLYPLAEIGFKNLLGCDPYLEADIKYANGLEIINSEVFTIEKKWNFIFYHHSFEHIGNPKDHLIKVHSILEDQGFCILRIPTSSSYLWEHYKTDWYQLDAPRHFYLHSIESIKILARESGFDLQEVIFDSTYHQFMHSEDIKNGFPMNQQPKPAGIEYLKRKREKMKYRKLIRKLNADKRGDQAIFILKKGN